MNNTEWDNYSTPSRDKGIENSLKRLVRKFNFFTGLSKKRVDKVIPYIRSCGDFEYAPGKLISYADFATRIAGKQCSSDPNLSIDARWGSVRVSKSQCRYEN